MRGPYLEEGAGLGSVTFLAPARCVHRLCNQTLSPQMTILIPAVSGHNVEEQGNSIASCSEEGSILHEGTDFTETPCFTSHLML